MRFSKQKPKVYKQPDLPFNDELRASGLTCANGGACGPTWCGPCTGCVQMLADDLAAGDAREAEESANALRDTPAES